MDFRFATRRLEVLYTQGKGAERYPEGVVDAFLDLVRHIEAATNEQDLRTPPSLRFEQLKGRDKGKSSLRLNDQYRLIVEVSREGPRKVVVVRKISKHYKRGGP